MTKIGFIGAGNMAGAIIAGILKKELRRPENIGVCDVDAAKCDSFAAKGCQVFEDIGALVSTCNIVVLAVKPQNLPQVMPKIKEAMTKEKVLVSIAAGISSNFLQEGVGFACKAVLAMPNTPLMVGQGAVALCRVEPTTQVEFEIVQELFAAAGLVEQVEESQMNAVIPVHGSSPAFIYRYAQMVAECAEKEGMNPEVANRLFSQSLIGAAHMMLETGLSHQQLIDMVCSPGGSTLAGLAAMEERGYSDSIREGFAACMHRAEELAKQQESK